jgi:uncharacterized protein (DUF885 family)
MDAFTKALEKNYQNYSAIFPSPPGVNVSLPDIVRSPDGFGVAAVYDGRILVHPGLIRASNIPILAAHEGWPGHHLHAAWLEWIANRHHRCLDFEVPSDIVEGWAMYVEKYATTGNNRAKIELEMLRAVRLVVDTGIHLHGWTFEQACRYMRRKLPSMRDLEIVSEVLRYTVLPGQALSYLIGQRSIEKMSAIWVEKTGDLRAFHEWLLQNSFASCSCLERWLHQDLTGQKKAESSSKP